MLKDTKGQPLPAGHPILGRRTASPVDNAVTQSTLDCGTKKFPDAIPYVLLLILHARHARSSMQRQMSKANPPSAQSGPQAAIMKYMPLLYVVWGWAFPAGLILYWTTANGIQIAQQTVMLRAGHIGPEALERAEWPSSGAGPRRAGPKKKGFMSWMNEKAQAAQGKQEEVKEQRPGQDDRRTARADPKPQAQQKGQQKKPQPKKPGPTQQQKKPQQSSGARQTASTRVPEDASPNGETGKPAKGAQPGNKLKPKRKPSSAPEGAQEDRRASAGTTTSISRSRPTPSRTSSRSSSPRWTSTRSPSPVEQGGRMYVDILDGDPDGHVAADRQATGRPWTPSRSSPARWSAAGSTSGSASWWTWRTTASAAPREVEETARAAAERALETGQEQALEPMDALERKIAHDAVAGIEGVRTESRGEEPARYVVVFPD